MFVLKSKNDYVIFNESRRFPMRGGTQFLPVEVYGFE